MIQTISKAIESNCMNQKKTYMLASLTDLNVSKNLFTEKGSAVFLKSLLNNNGLQKLNIQGIRFTKESLVKIEELKKEKPDLLIVD